jgi:hypothetical protein
MSTTEDRPAGELRDGYIQIDDQRLHYVEAGEGPLIVLLHGFPEFWFDWRLQIRPLVAAGFRIVAPTRAANLSSKAEEGRSGAARSGCPPWSSVGKAIATSARARRARPDDVPNLDRVDRLPGASH